MMKVNSRKLLDSIKHSISQYSKKLIKFIKTDMINKVIAYCKTI